MLFGTTTRTSRYELDFKTPYFGVRFRPGKASVFLREKISELTDRHIEVPDFLGLRADEVFEMNGFAARRMRLESLLLSAVSQHCKPEQRVISHAVSEIDHHWGTLRVRDLAARCNLSERQLERIFLTEVGVTPKLYSRIRRLRSVLNQWQDPPGEQRPTLAEIAATYGYADQSHLARELRLFSHSLQE